MSILDTPVIDSIRSFAVSTVKMEYFYLCSVASVTALVYLRSNRNEKSDENDNTDTEDTTNNKESDSDPKYNDRLKSLQFVYLPAHLLSLFSDWLQVLKHLYSAWVIHFFLAIISGTLCVSTLQRLWP